MGELDDIIKHFGVKGMKWGVRKQKDSINSKDRSIKKGTTIQNISSRKFETGTRHLYGAYTSYDKDAYADLMGNWMYSSKDIYKNELVVKKDIKLPSDKVVVQSFMKLAKSNPQQVAKDMSEAYNQVSRFSSKTVKHFDKKISKIPDEYSKKGEKLTKEYIKLMVSDKAASSRSQFFGSLIKKGYDGMSDANDRDGGAQDPLIIFNPKNSLGNVKSVPLTKDDLNNYYQMTNFDREFMAKGKKLNEVQR